MDDLETIYNFLKNINFDMFELHTGGIIIDSKKWIESEYQACIGASGERIKMLSYKRMKQVYSNFAAVIQSS